MSTHSSNSSPFHDRYTAFIDQVIASTLKGQIRSKEKVYQLLVEQLEPGTGEIFEYCLEQRVSTLQYQLATTTDELKQAKAGRQVRAIKTLQDAWERWQRDHEAQNACTAAVQQILKTEASERLSVLIQVLDPNQTNVFNRQHLQQLAKALQEAGEVLPNETEAFELRQLASGLTRGLASFAQLEDRAKYLQRQRAVANHLGMTVRNVQRLAREWQRSGLAGIVRRTRSDRGDHRLPDEWRAI